MSRWYDIFGIVSAISMAAPMLCPLIINHRQAIVLGRRPTGFEDIDPLGIKIVTYCGIFFLFGLLNFGIYCILMVYF